MWDLGRSKNKKQTSRWTKEIQMEPKLKKNKWREYLSNQTADSYDGYIIPQENLTNMAAKATHKISEHFSNEIEKKHMGNPRL